MPGTSALVGAAMAVGLASAALAEGASGLAGVPTQSTTVSFAGLDLDTDIGARIALGRIRDAARRLCGDEWSYKTIGAGVWWDGCYRGAVDRAVAEVGRPALTALNAAASDPPAGAR